MMPLRYCRHFHADFTLLLLIERWRAIAAFCRRAAIAAFDAVTRAHFAIERCCRFLRCREHAAYALPFTPPER